MDRANFLKTMMLMAGAGVQTFGANEDKMEWELKFKKFLKALNLFLMEYNEGKTDYRLWGKVAAAFEELTGTKQRS